MNRILKKNGEVFMSDAQTGDYIKTSDGAFYKVVDTFPNKLHMRTLRDNLADPFGKVVPITHVELERRGAEYCIPFIVLEFVELLAKLEDKMELIIDCTRIASARTIAREAKQIARKGV